MSGGHSVSEPSVPVRGWLKCLIKKENPNIHLYKNARYLIHLNDK
jgi:hypothetical protein